MTNAVSVESIVAEQEVLTKDFEQALAIMQEAKSDYAEKKTTLTTFNNKYGRVIALMNED